jgi:hypothetical protein
MNPNEIEVIDYEVVVPLNVPPTWIDVYLSCFKWYRKYKKGVWYKHQFTNDALDLSVNLVGFFWTRYGKLNRYSDVVSIERY